MFRRPFPIMGYRRGFSSMGCGRGFSSMDWGDDDNGSVFVKLMKGILLSALPTTLFFYITECNDDDDNGSVYLKLVMRYLWSALYMAFVFGSMIMLVTAQDMMFCSMDHTHVELMMCALAWAYLIGLMTTIQLISIMSSAMVRVIKPMMRSILATKIVKHRSSERPWAGLSVDLIRSIMNRLHYVDQIRVRAVCKSWREVNMDGVKFTDKSPWMMFITESGLCVLSDFYKRKYPMKKNPRSKEIIYDSTVICSKNGWVLLVDFDYPFIPPKHGTKLGNFTLSCWYSIMNGTEFGNCISFYLYSPFHDKMVELPKWRIEIKRNGNPWVKAIFADTPNSPDCVIFALIAYPAGKNCIGLCRNVEGRWRWTTFWFDGEYGRKFEDDEIDFGDEVVEEERPVAKLEYTEGMFYCSFYKPKEIGVFNVALEQWKLYSHPLRELNYEPWDTLIEFDGNLLLCYKGDHRVLSFFILDRSQMSWFPVENLLENRSLFLDKEVGNDFGSIILPAEGKTAKRVYRCYSRQPLFLTNLLQDEFSRSTRKKPRIAFWVQPPRW